MTLKSYLNIMFLATFVAFISWMMVVYYVDPFKSGFIGFFLFYATLFFSLVGIFTLSGFKLRQKFLNNELLFVLIGLSFRQAIWLSIFFIGILLMQGFRILTWWDGALLFCSVFLIEAFFLTE
ncbi:MAG: hypothetical protein GF347_00020 [Candidatus Moranbacteria bacterium]|nr:hypothetical protein [Candidatus Moranbacteria bacterium]